MSRLSWNLSANLLSNAWATGLALVLTPVYVRMLGLESYGLIGFYMSWLAILGILDTGISATAMRELAWVAARPEERKQTATLLRTLEIAYWAIVGGFGALLLVGVFWLAPGWFESGLAPEVLRQTLLLMVMALVAQVPSGLYVGGLMGLQRQVECSTLVALFGTVRSGGAVAALVLAGPDIRIFFLWQIAASALQTGGMRWVLCRHLPPAFDRPSFSPAMLRRLRAFAGGMSAITALSLAVMQVDKIILSALLPLETFGLYMLAWMVASGLARLVTPLVQAFGPRFTQMVSTADSGLGSQVRLACQLTNVLILSPAAVLIVFAEPVLLAWTGNPVVASGAAPLLPVLVIGTLLSSCGYPAVTAFYSTGRVGPVVAFHVIAMAIMLPVLVAGVILIGAAGAALAWAVYGLLSYVAYHALGMASVRESALTSALRDLVVPACACLAVAVLGRQWLTPTSGVAQLLLVVTTVLVLGWAAAAVVSRDLLRTVIGTFRWNPAVSS